MTWRTVVITKHVKLTYKSNYLIVRGETVDMVHLSEINTIIIETTQVALTAHLISELVKRKIKVVFCDEKRNPESELIPYYGSHDSSKKVQMQTEWDKLDKQAIWTKVIHQKILNQAGLLKEKSLYEQGNKLQQYANELVFYDATNREGHAAKVYFNALFGKGFTRDQDNDINAGLDYGYSILLSIFNREIANNGYLTQLGLKHANQFNYFNLSSDLMEPFRPLVDRVVFDNQTQNFDSEFKHELIRLMDEEIMINMKNYNLTQAVQIYLKSIFKSLEEKDAEIRMFEWR